jgi:hypothetical protein
MRQFMKMFRKTLEEQIFGWTPMIDILHTAIRRWGVTQMRRLSKELFNQGEYKTLWCRLSQFADVESQRKGRLEARELGFVLPKGCEKKYFRWVE